MTTTTHLPTTDEMRGMNPDGIARARADLLAGAESLLTRSTDREMSAGDAEEYRQIEMALNRLTDHERRASLEPANGRAAEILNLMNTHQDSASERRSATPTRIGSRSQDLS